MVSRALLTACLTLHLAAGAASQQRLDWQNELWRAERIAITGDLGAPPLPPVWPDGPRGTMLEADRVPHLPDASAYASLGAPTKIDMVLPAGEEGTGTDKAEVFQYQLPAGYDSEGPLLPLVVAWHGYGEAAKSVANKSLLDEECNARGWLFMAPTGIDDQLFGAPVPQANVEAAIHWMIDNTRVDPERVAMVGFSMGGGIAANFAARRRDPDGLVLSAVGLVSASGDWTMTYASSTPAIKQWMKHPLNFGFGPGGDAFAYQRSSALHFDPDTYLPEPLPGTLLPSLTMATNLGSTAVWQVWDQDDTVDVSLAQNPVLAQALAELGGEVVSQAVSGTVNALGQPAPHSWGVLDVVAFFDWLEGQRAVRRPRVFEALLGESQVVSHASVVQREGHAFSRLTSRQDTGAALHGAQNVARVSLDAGRLPPGSKHFSLHVADGLAAELTLAGFEQRPSRLVDGDERLLRDVASDPLGEALTLTVAPPGAPPVAGNLVASSNGAAARVVFDPTWTVALSTAPNPVSVGSTAVLTVDAGPGVPAVLLWIGADEALQPLSNGLVLSVLPAAPPLLVPLPPGGRLELQVDVPANGAWIGQHLHLQAAALGAGGEPLAVSNAWLARLQ